MKKITLLFISIVAVLSVFSQPVLTSNINLTIGDTYQYNGYQEVTNIEPGDGGANLTWDFSNINGNFYTGIGAICVDPSTTAFADSAAVANANICTSPIGGVGPYQYYDNNNSSQNLIAMGFLAEGNNSFTTYTNNATGLEFPFTYGDSFDDTWESLMYYIELGHYFMRDSSIVTVEADAYGTVTTPTGEFHNVLRIKRTTLDYSWTNYSGDEWILNGSFTDINFEWYAPNIKVPVMIIQEIEWMPNFYSVRYLVEYDFTTGIEDQADYHLEIFPNPTTDRVNIKTDELIVHISIYTLNGQQMDVVNSQTGQSHQQIINFNKYPKGIYLIKVGFEDGSIVTERIVKQ